MTKNEFIKRAEAVNIKKSRGHDAPSYEWDIKFDNQLICNCWDDSRGGELEITNIGHHKIENIYSTIDVNSLYDKEYKWTTTLELLLSDLLNIAIQKKDYKKGVVLNNGTIIGYNRQIPTIIKKYGNNGLKMIQQLIDDVEDKDTILNKEYLLSLNHQCTDSTALIKI
tara:strand:+ start:6998 stop:7501 length:504 start_codon:yes stop_codon:yes gene_type:complete